MSSPSNAIEANATYRDLCRLQPPAPVCTNDEWRLRYHLMPPAGWLNDPNGLCYHDGQYHVFFQYSPFNPDGGLKFWGHYASRDLVSWELLPTAIYPDQPYDCNGVYSGSAISENGCIYAFYTGNVKLSGNNCYDYITTGREHNTILAISRDGVSFNEKRLLMRNSDYPSGLTLHVRDPKVWKQDDVYYMLLGARTVKNVGEVLVLSSSDMVNWKHINTLSTKTPFGFMWECPDLFTIGAKTYLSVSPQGLTRETERFQNVYQSGYFELEGDFKGEYSLKDFREYDYGFDFYAPQTFTDGNRRILIGWMGMPDAQEEYVNPTVSRGWQHTLTVPRELTLCENKLLQWPVHELEQLREKPVSQRCDGSLTMQGLRAFDLELRTSDPFELILRGSARIRWCDGLLTLDFLKDGGGRGVRHVRIERLKELRILADTSSIEIFANHGEAVMSSRYYPTADVSLVLNGHGDLCVWKLRRMEDVSHV